MSDHEEIELSNQIDALHSQLSTALERVKELESYKSKWISDAVWNKGLADGANKRITALETENAELAEALRMLHDYQNGCPLPTYEKGWTEAMRLTENALAKIAEAKKSQP
jgi:hypothetical protein